MYCVAQPINTMLSCPTTLSFLVPVESWTIFPFGDTPPRWISYRSVALDRLNREQHANVLSHRGEGLCCDLRMKLCVATCPIQTLQLIDKDGSIHLPDGDRQRKRVWLSLAGKRAYYGQAAGTVISQICEDQRRTSFCLFPAHLGVEIQNHDISCLRNVSRYHSTTSFPISAPVESSAYRSSGVIWETS